MDTKSFVVVVCKSNQRTTSPVKYEIFDYYSKIALKLGDEQWKTFFQALSRGNSQKELKFNGRVLTAKKGNGFKVFEVRIPENMNINTLTEDDINDFKSCKEFIKSNCRFFEDEEEEHIRVEEVIEQEDELVLENKFKLGIVNQSTLIKKFCRRECRKNNLNEETCDAMISTINALFSSKYFTSKSIMQNVSNGEIDHIIGFTVNRAGFFVDNSVEKTRKLPKTVKKEKERCFCSSGVLSKVEQKI